MLSDGLPESHFGAGVSGADVLGVSVASLLIVGGCSVGTTTLLVFVALVTRFATARFLNIVPHCAGLLRSFKEKLITDINRD